MEKPWIDGPKELIIHASDHLRNKSDFDKRIAFISIDNAVELIIKTYLGLPKRIRKTIGPSRKEIQEAENSFPTYLDLLEKYDIQKLVGISLEDIEWFHRLRNQLYHMGNGITVDLSKVESYYEISIALFQSLFEENIKIENKPEYTTKLGSFLDKWIKMETDLRAKLPPRDGASSYDWKRDYLKTHDTTLVMKFNDASLFRNQVVHGVVEPSEEDLDYMIKNVEEINRKIKEF